MNNTFCSSSDSMYKIYNEEAMSDHSDNINEMLSIETISNHSDIYSNIMKRCYTLWSNLIHWNSGLIVIERILNHIKVSEQNGNN